jgi:hypothetical protein
MGVIGGTYGCWRVGGGYWFVDSSVWYRGFGAGSDSFGCFPHIAEFDICRVFFAVVWAFIVWVLCLCYFASLAGVVVFVVGISASSAFVLCITCVCVVCETPAFEALLGWLCVEVFLDAHGVSPARDESVVEKFFLGTFRFECKDE